MKSSTHSLFAQVLGLVDRREFEALAIAHAVEKSSKGFGSWEQFVAMTFAQLSDAGSLREISLGLASASGKLRHLGIESAPCRSTLSCANANRAWQFFEYLFAAIYAMAAGEAVRHRKESRLKKPPRAVNRAPPGRRRARPSRANQAPIVAKRQKTCGKIPKKPLTIRDSGIDYGRNEISHRH